MKKQSYLNIFIIILIGITFILISNIVNSKHYIEVCYKAQNNGIMQIYYDVGEGFLMKFYLKKNIMILKKICDV